MFFPHIPFLGGSGSPPPTPPPASKPNDAGAISGNFDPTALERGAKALRALDSSPNSGKAFELARIQEVTKQKELVREAEVAQARRAELQLNRVRLEEEEKRRTQSHQQEEERVTAQYKAQLSAEAYAKKLQDQQKQNEQWLQQQHQQFLLHEQVRKQNEQDILEMKRRQAEQEKLLEKELIRARIQEETKGRIEQERSNFDIDLQKLTLKAEEARKTQLQVISSVFSSLGSACNTLLEDKTKRSALILGITGIALGIYGSKSATKMATQYLEARLGRPSLVRETSRRAYTPKQLLRYLSIPAWFRSKPVFYEKIVLPAELAQRLQWTTNSLLSSRKNRTPFRNLLMYGQPGTGKTLFARTLARESGLDYAIMTGGDIGPLGSQAVEELNKLFRWANRSKKGLILFIDEAEAFLRKGRGSAQMSETLHQTLSAFLHHTGTESHAFSVVLATNIRDSLDPAVLDRVDDEFEFNLPEENERYRMLKMFFEEYFSSRQKWVGKKLAIDISEIDDAYVRSLAQRTQGLSGRQLAKLVIAMQSAVYGAGINKLTKGLADTILGWKLANLDKENAFSEKLRRPQQSD